MEARGSVSREQPLTAIFKRLISALDRNYDVLDKVSRKLEYRSSGSQAHLVTEIPSTINKLEDEKDKRDDQVLVEIKLTFMKINDIDTVNQQFEAEIFIQAKWEEPLLLKLSSKEFDPNTMWTPRLLIMNLDGEFQTSRISYNILQEVPGYKYPLVLCLWRFKGFFKENLELEHFPMDVQDLSISVATELAEDQIILIEDQRSLSSVNTKTFMDAQEWSIYSHVETYRDKTTVEYASSTVHPILHVQCRVARKIGYFVWNIIFIVNMIYIFAFSTFPIEPHQPERLALTFFLLFTTVTIIVGMRVIIPNTNVPTWLDLYVLAALMFLGMHATQNACMKHLAKHSSQADVEAYDDYSMISLAAVFILFHTIFGLYIFYTATRRRRIMVEKDKIYKGKRKMLEKYEAPTALSGITIENAPKPKGSLETLR